ncbi:hypothetical protein [Okeania sp. SIO3I5]|nr:hypothetical protein [Okeania sp. SIO3I5]
MLKPRDERDANSTNSLSRALTSALRLTKSKTAIATIVMPLNNILTG